MKKPYQTAGKCPECESASLKQSDESVTCTACKWRVDLKPFPLPGAIGYYVGSDGEAYSIHKGFRRLGRKINHGVIRVHLSVAGQHYYPYLAPAILTSFKGPRPPGLDPHHADGNKANCRPDNLTWRLIRARQVSAEIFVKTWQSAASVGEVADALGMEAVSAYTRAANLRRAGVPLKDLSFGRRGLDYDALAKLAREIDGQSEEKK